MIADVAATVDFLKRQYNVDAVASRHRLLHGWPRGLSLGGGRRGVYSRGYLLSRQHCARLGTRYAIAVRAERRKFVARCRVISATMTKIRRRKIVKSSTPNLLNTENSTSFMRTRTPATPLWTIPRRAYRRGRRGRRLAAVIDFLRRHLVGRSRSEATAPIGSLNLLGEYCGARAKKLLKQLNSACNFSRSIVQ